jgi:hypothetical protein
MTFMPGPIHVSGDVSQSEYVPRWAPYTRPERAPDSVPERVRTVFGQNNVEHLAAGKYDGLRVVTLCGVTIPDFWNHVIVSKAPPTNGPFTREAVLRAADALVWAGCNYCVEKLR